MRVFDSNVKESLLQLVTSSLRFRNINRLVLLTGPPGTGKTLLAQALAQTVSIRLNHHFSQTMMLHLRAATLLAQYFGQSAKQICEIFSSIGSLASANPSTFYVLHIDEIESLAGSHSRANDQGEVQDAIRATNELLVGFDGIKNRRNVLIICSSNLLDSLDNAFKDRCAEKIVVLPPRPQARYAILRDALLQLAQDKAIDIPKHDSLPLYKDDIPGLDPEHGSAVCLRNLVDGLESASDGDGISARWLAQLPQLALATYLHADDSCTLSDAVVGMQEYVERREKAAQKETCFDEHESVRDRPEYVLSQQSQRAGVATLPTNDDLVRHVV